MPTVIKEPNSNGVDLTYNFGDTYSVVFAMAEAADSMPVWGTTVGVRDRALRAFYPQEPYFASALFTTVSKYAAFGWSLEGPPLTVRAVQRLLHSSDQGAGWMSFVVKVLVDLFTQDNGAFIEVVRSEANSPSAPPVGLNHLDSGRCVRTGRHEEPVIYYDLEGRGHLLKWYEVLPLAEFPSPNQLHRGTQMCALSRMLRSAQIMRETGIFKREKVSGRFTRQLHLIGGMPTKMIDDAIKQHQANADSTGLMRYITPVVIGALDPTATVSHAQIDLATLPDGYDEETAMRWYIAQMALAFGGDYSDYAPLPGANLGSGKQAEVAHAKSRGKGPALFMRTLEQTLNFHGVMPRSTTFTYGEQDYGAQYERILMQKERALYIQTLIASGAITTEVARQMLVDAGDLDLRYLQMMGEQDATGEEQLDASTPPKPDAPAVKPGEPGPKAPPGTTAAPPAPDNNNALQTKPASQTVRPAVV